MTDRQRFRRARLSGREILCLALTHYDGLTIRGVARQAHIPRATVGRVVLAARRKLKLAGLRLRCLTINPGRMIQLGEGDIAPSDIKARW